MKSLQSAWSEGLIVAAHGRHFVVRNAAGVERLARPAGRDLRLVCGDKVRCTLDTQHDELHIQTPLARGSSLWRSDSRGRNELVAANITLLIIVIAPEPQPDFFIVDRYLAAATCAPCEPLLVCNKQDLPCSGAMQKGCDELQQLGIPLLRCSSLNAAGVAPLQARLANHSALLVGQSGVGKSSLLRALAPEAPIETGALTREREGRHTTSATRLYSLGGGAQLLDSPGVRDFAPALDQLDVATLGYRELVNFGPHCRFGDCRHWQEPGCAVLAAVNNGAMSERRYDSYRRLRRLHDALMQQQARGGR